MGIPAMIFTSNTPSTVNVLFVLQLGLEPHHAVGIIGFNSPEWFMADLGAIFAG